MVKNINIILPVFLFFYFINCIYANPGGPDEESSCEYLYFYNCRDTSQIKMYEE